MNMRKSARWAVILSAIIVNTAVFAGETGGAGDKPSAQTDPGGKSMGHHHQHGKWRGKHGGGKWMSHLEEQLELTDAQRAEIDKLKQASREASRPLHERLKASKRAEREAMMADAGEDELKTLARGSADIRVELMLQRREAREKILAILTPEQQARMDELEAQRRKQRQEHGKMWREKKAKEVESEAP